MGFKFLPVQLWTYRGGEVVGVCWRQELGDCVALLQVWGYQDLAGKGFFRPLQFSVDGSRFRRQVCLSGASPAAVDETSARRRNTSTACL